MDVIQLQPGWACYFSIVRYVADPFRDEPRNVGVVVLCPEQNYAGAKFRLASAGIREGTPRYRFLEALLATYSDELRGDLLPGAPSRWTRDRLEEMHLNHTDMLHFTAPVPAVGDPRALLEQLYRTRVEPRHLGVGERNTHMLKPSVRVTVRALQKTLEPQGKATWVHYGRKAASESPFPFDITIRNGHLYYAIQTLSFATGHLHAVEADGAWYAVVWPEVRQTERDAQGILLVEPPSETGAAQEHYQRVIDWVKKADVDVRLLGEVGGLAAEIANKLG